MARAAPHDAVRDYERLVQLCCYFQEAVIAVDNLDDIVTDNPDLGPVLGGHDLQQVLSSLREMSDNVHTAKQVLGLKLKDALQALQGSQASHQGSQDAGSFAGQGSSVEDSRPYVEGCINNFEELQAAWHRHENCPES